MEIILKSLEEYLYDNFGKTSRIDNRIRLQLENGNKYDILVQRFDSNQGDNDVKSI